MHSTTRAAKKPKPLVDVAASSRRDEETTQLRPIPKPPAIGDVVAEKYRLVRELGRGGMGRIFAADHLLLDTTVALKFMHPHLTRDRISVERFAREARAAAALKSEYAARIVDVDQLRTGELYIVMEYLEGASLDALVEDGVGLPISDAVKYAVQACNALAEAHAANIIHRDVKPANLFVTKGKSGESMIKVLDFGLAKSSQPDGFASGVVQALGTPRYMSPEQIGCATDIDGRTDVWSIGVTLYELLTGRCVFGGSGSMAIFARILEGYYVPVRAHRPEVSPALAAIIDRCLMRDRTARFATVKDLARALETMDAPVAVTANHAATLVSPSDPLIPAAKPPSPRVTWSRTAPTPMTFAPPPPVPPPSPSIAPVVMPGVGHVAMAHSPNDVTQPRRAANMDRGNEPTLRQTVIAALAGPLLVAIAAGAMAVVVGTSPARASGSAARVTAATTATAVTAATAAHVTAKAAVTTPRAKAVAAQAVSARCVRNPRGPTCAALARN